MPNIQPLNSTIHGVTFTNNSAPFAGGGFYMYGFWNPTISNCSFTNNSVSNLTTVTIGENAGGGMYVSNLPNVNLSLANVCFTGNSAFTGAGLEVYQGNVTLDGCAFNGNNASSSGAGFRWELFLVGVEGGRNRWTVPGSLVRRFLFYF